MAAETPTIGLGKPPSRLGSFVVVHSYADDDDDDDDDSGDTRNAIEMGPLRAGGGGAPAHATAVAAGQDDSPDGDSPPADRAPPLPPTEGASKAAAAAAAAAAAGDEYEGAFAASEDGADRAADSSSTITALGGGESGALRGAGTAGGAGGAAVRASVTAGGAKMSSESDDGLASQRRPLSRMGQLVETLRELPPALPSMFRWIREWRTINLAAMAVLLIFVFVYLIDPIVILAVDPALLRNLGVSPWLIVLYVRGLTRLTTPTMACAFTYTSMHTHTRTHRDIRSHTHAFQPARAVSVCDGGARITAYGTFLVVLLVGMYGAYRRRLALFKVVRVGAVESNRHHHACGYHDYAS
jgi:hypothetical protein